MLLTFPERAKEGGGERKHLVVMTVTLDLRVAICDTDAENCEGKEELTIQTTSCSPLRFISLLFGWTEHHVMLLRKATGEIEVHIRCQTWWRRCDVRLPVELVMEAAEPLLYCLLTFRVVLHSEDG